MGSQAVTSYRVRLQDNRLGLWLFLVSEAFMFAGLFVSRFYLWRGTRPDLDQMTALILTVVLLLSSFFMNRSETAIAHGDQDRMQVNLLITAWLGIVFLLGVVTLEWSGHLKPSDGVFGAVFYGMTGMHALHVLSGIVILLITWYRGYKGVYSAEQHWGVEACAVWWHYVDLVWVFFYPALYLIGTAA